MTPYYDDGKGIVIYNGDCREVMADLADDSIDLICTDPPYFKVKSDWWDRQWDKPEAFLAWMGTLCDEWQRVLKPNGSLYCFASPQMAWGVEGEIRKWLNVLQRIAWRKEEGIHWRQSEGQLRNWFPQTENIIFAEQINSDNHALGETDYTSKCDELRGFVFEPLRAYLDGERERAGFSVQQVEEGLTQSDSGRKTGANHWFAQVQYQLPTRRCYEWLKTFFGEGYLTRDHEDLRREYEDLRREYEDLRREYEDLRRPFFASDKRPYTDVWDFPTVTDYPGKHPCQKPLAMIEHIIETSSKPGAVVLDCFGGSGVTARASRNFGRSAIVCEIDEKYCEIAANRLRQGVLDFGE